MKNKAFMHGNLPTPLALMLERKHGMFDSGGYDYRFDGVSGDAEALVALPPAKWWAVTEKWKTKDGSQPSKGYAVLMRVLGAVFALVGGMLIKWAVK